MGSYQSNIHNLKVGTIYYVRAYATNETGTVYGEQKTVITKDGLPTVETNPEATSTALTINAGGTVIDNGGFAVTERGICYSATNSEPTISNAFVASGKGNGAFNVAIAGLSASTKYYLRAYATNENGTAYGKVISIITKDGTASVTLSEITNITALTASATVTINDAGNATLQSCGICWSINPNPSKEDNSVASSGKALNTAYPCNMSELQPNTIYYVRGYATTDVTTAYSEQKTFTTTSGLPTITTSSTTATSTSITSGGEITDDGGYNIIARGVCYSTTNSTPTIEDSYTTAGIGTGAFISVITSVTVSTTYYVRAYATNSIGTGYGDAIAITTGNGLPMVTTTAISKNGSAFLSGGYVSDDGGSAVTERGICYGNFPHPDLSATYSHTSDGAGTGYYTSTISAISGVIYLRAYATNVNGTTYGEEISIDLDYLSLPSFTFNDKTYRVAPNAPNTMTWDQAITYCNGLALYGYSDWRMPSREELYQMYVLRSSIGDFITTRTGSVNNYSNEYWSDASGSLGGTIYYYFVDFNSGLEGSRYGGTCSVRPIRIEK